MEQWRDLYLAALLETDTTHLRENVQLAEDAIRQQMKSLNGKLSRQELQEMQDALNGLQVLRREFKDASSGSSESFA
jgi:hypothetical protein